MAPPLVEKNVLSSGESIRSLPAQHRQRVWLQCTQLLHNGGCEREIFHSCMQAFCWHPRIAKQSFQESFPIAINLNCNFNLPTQKQYSPPVWTERSAKSNAHLWHIWVWYSQLCPGQLQATCYVNDGCQCGTRLVAEIYSIWLLFRL